MLEKGNNFRDFLFASLDTEVLQKQGLLLTHSVLVDSSTVICCMSLFVSLGGVGSILSLLFNI